MTDILPGLDIGAGWINRLFTLIIIPGRDMREELPAEQPAFELEISQIAHLFSRFVLAVRYRKNLVIAVMASSVLLGVLYYATATRLYSSKAALLVSQTGRDQLNTSIANEESLRQDVMPTFENIIRSAKVLEGALQNLKPADRIDLKNLPRESWVEALKSNIKSKVIRATNILEVSYCSKDPQVAAHVVRAVVQSYLDFMDRIHKGTAGEINRVLTEERNEVAEKLNRKQEELLEARRNLADLGFRSESKTLHPIVQRAVYFNDALTETQKQRVECEAAQAGLQSAIRNGEDLSQYITLISGGVGKELLMNSLGLGPQEVTTRSSMEQSLLAARAELQTLQQNLGPRHPEVIALTRKIRLTEEYLQASRPGMGNPDLKYRQNQLGPWLAQMLQQKLDEARKKEEILKARFEEARAEAVALSGQLARVEMLERDIKRLGDMNDVLLNQIASIDLKQNGQDVRVEVIEEPKVETSPISPEKSLVIVVTLLSGFGLSLVLVTVFDALDDRFRSLEELQNRLGVAVLTVIHRLHPPESKGLQALSMFAAPTAPECESFRTLRTALTLTHQTVRKILLSSVESSDGKTTILANLGVCYAQAGKRALLIDADLRRAGLTHLLNLQGTTGLSEILREEGRIEALAPVHLCASGMKGLDVLPSGPRPTNPAELLASPRFSQLLAWAESVYDFILIDSTPALITADPAIIAQVIDGVVFVIQPVKNRRRAITRVVDRFGLLKLPVLGLIVNAIGSKGQDDYYDYPSYYSDGYPYYGEEEQDDQPADDDHAAAEQTILLPCKTSRCDGEHQKPFPQATSRRVA